MRSAQIFFSFEDEQLWTTSPSLADYERSIRGWACRGRHFPVDALPAELREPMEDAIVLLTRMVADMPNDPGIQEAAE